MRRRKGKPSQIPPDILRVESAIAQASGNSIESIRGYSRDRGVVLARHAIWMMAVDHLGYSGSFVADLYGRDHTTVQHGVKRLRGSEVEKKVLAGIEHCDPEVFKMRLSQQKIEERGIDDWKFEPVENVGIPPAQASA